MSNLVTTTQLAPPAQPVPMSSLLAGLHALPTGTYCLGAAEDGLPVISKPATQATIASGTKDCGLLRLGHTVGATALRLSNQTGVSIVADLNMRYWPTAADAMVFEPDQVNNLIGRLQTWDAGNRHMLFILDDTAEDAWTTPQDIQALTEHPAASVLVLARPEHARSLIDALPESYMHKYPDGTKARAAYLFPVYGQGSQHLTQITGIPADLDYGQFAIRHQSRWLTFTTVSQE